MKHLAAILLVAVAACAPFGDARQAQRYFVLEPPLPANFSIPARIGSASASAFYDTEAIAYSRSAGTRGYYQLNSWTEPPARRIGELLAQRSDGSGPVLSFHLLEMYHDAASPPGTVRVVLAAEAGGKREVFTATAPAPTFDAPGAVKAFNDALGRALGELRDWLASTSG